jgi:hypothetical protein
MKMTYTPAKEFVKGDVIVTPNEQGNDTQVTLLKDVEEGEDRFGRPLLKFWGRREDTGVEGYMSFGPSGHAMRLDEK